MSNEDQVNITHGIARGIIALQLRAIVAEVDLHNSLIAVMGADRRAAIPEDGLQALVERIGEV
jgi:hypothetical protein